MENKMVLDTLRNCGSLLDGHFLLSSGKHSDKYCQCAKLLMYPDKAAQVLEVVAKQLKTLNADMVVGPAMGGITVAYELARQLGIPGIFTERVDNVMTLRRGFEVAKGTRVIVTEDVITTGKSSLEAVKVLLEQGAIIVAIACIVDRRAKDLTIDYPIYSATTLNVNTFDAQNCPLCKSGTTPEKPGSRLL